MSQFADADDPASVDSYVENTCRYDDVLGAGRGSGRKARRDRAKMRTLCELAGEEAPAWAQARPSGNQTSHHAKAASLAELGESSVPLAVEDPFMLVEPVSDVPLPSDVKSKNSAGPDGVDGMVRHEL